MSAWPAEEIEQACGGVTGAAREILGCLLPYDAETGGLVADEAYGRRVRVCVRPYHHEGPCRVSGPVFKVTRDVKHLGAG